jgi:hypothetical protein
MSQIHDHRRRSSFSRSGKYLDRARGAQLPDAGADCVCPRAVDALMVWVPQRAAPGGRRTTHPAGRDRGREGGQPGIRGGGDVVLVANAGADRRRPARADPRRGTPGRVPAAARGKRRGGDHRGDAGPRVVRDAALSEAAELRAEPVWDAFRRRTAEIVVSQSDLPPDALKGLSRPRLLVGSQVRSDPSALSTLDRSVVNALRRRRSAPPRQTLPGRVCGPAMIVMPPRCSRTT